MSFPDDFQVDLMAQGLAFRVLSPPWGLSRHGRTFPAAQGGHLKLWLSRPGATVDSLPCPGASLSAAETWLSVIRRNGKQEEGMKLQDPCRALFRLQQSP